MRVCVHMCSVDVCLCMRVYACVCVCTYACASVCVLCSLQVCMYITQCYPVLLPNPTSAGDHIIFDESDCTVIVCMDFIKGSCTRPHCKYLHPPAHLQTTVRARQNRVYFSTPPSPMYSTPGPFVPQAYGGLPQAVAYPMPTATGYIGGYQPQPMYMPMPVPMPSPPPAYYQEPVQPAASSPIPTQPSLAQRMTASTTTLPSGFEGKCMTIVLFSNIAVFIDVVVSLFMSLQLLLFIADEARSTHTACSEEGRSSMIEHTLE